jgi:hypothetical protein
MSETGSAVTRDPEGTMSTLDKWRGMLVFLAVAVGLGLLVANGRHRAVISGDSDSIEVTDYRRPQPRPDDQVVDDRIETKSTRFEPGLVDSRPLDNWLLNASEAVIRLDTPMMFPEADAKLLELHPSYKAAIEAAAATSSRQQVLPSVCMIDCKAKQFDDGLVAALDLAYYRGLDGTLTSHVTLIRRLLEKVGPESPAAPFLAAGLTLAGEEHQVKDMAARASWLTRFEGNLARSRPVGFYTWSKPLSESYRFFRYFQSRLPQGETAVVRALADTLKSDPALMADYKKAISFHARLTNPTHDLTCAEIADHTAEITDPRRISLFPNSTSRETELFGKLFPTGLPADVDLMRTLIVKIRMSEISLVPRPEGGWYDYQVYALETLIQPDSGEEKDKLLLTRAYKERMLDAFKALMTRRRETHIRDLDVTTAEAPPPTQIVPRLRLEPCPTYYLRTARAYSFLASFLESSVGVPALKRLHGLKQDGERSQDLYDELGSMRDLFYGFYLVSAEDIGMKPHLLNGEPIDRVRCIKAAEQWLAQPLSDPDLAVDTRVAVPIYFDRPRTKTRLWTTLGVRLAKIEASYARSPSIKTKEGAGEWRKPEARTLGTSEYLIAVDQFSEVETNCVCVPTREELRSICDLHKTKDAILAALKAGK